MKPVADNLYLLPLTPPLAGFENFISAWLYLGKPSFIVDVGPASTATKLLEYLDRLKVEKLDYILLTHIHLDHAGAIGEVADRLAGTPIVCQTAAIEHLIDPQRLWEGTKSVLGETALGYGPIKPVAAERLVDAAGFRDAAIEAIETPGHAAHHVSYVKDEFLFAGETAGVWMDIGPAGEYTRPATPPRFHMETAVASLKRLMAKAPRWLCYGHFGISDDTRNRLQRHYDQMLYWERTIREVAGRQEDPADIEDSCLKALLAADPLLKNFGTLPKAIQDREAYFMRNSIRGYLGWLDSRKVDSVK